jgi:hypothetical protein
MCPQLPPELTEYIISYAADLNLFDETWRLCREIKGMTKFGNLPHLSLTCKAYYSYIQRLDMYLDMNTVIKKIKNPRVHYLFLNGVHMLHFNCDLIADPYSTSTLALLWKLKWPFQLYLSGMALTPMLLDLITSIEHFRCKNPIKKIRFVELMLEPYKRSWTDELYIPAVSSSICDILRKLLACLQEISVDRDKVTMFPRPCSHCQIHLPQLKDFSKCYYCKSPNDNLALCPDCLETSFDSLHSHQVDLFADGFRRSICECKRCSDIVACDSCYFKHYCRHCGSFFHSRCENHAMVVSKLMPIITTCNVEVERAEACSGISTSLSECMLHYN